MMFPRFDELDEQGLDAIVGHFSRASGFTKKHRRDEYLVSLLGFGDGVLPQMTRLMSACRQDPDTLSLIVETMGSMGKEAIQPLRELLVHEKERVLKSRSRKMLIAQLATAINNLETT